MKHTTYRRAPCRVVLPVLAVALLAMSGCSARRLLGIEEEDTASFEAVILEKVTGENESAVLEEMNLDHVTSLLYLNGVFDDSGVRLTDKDDIREVMAHFVGVTFTRLNSQGTDWERENDLFDIIRPITDNGLVLHYSMDFRDTDGSFYVSEAGQVCWFTGDGQAILVSEEGAVSYTELVAWFLKNQYGFDVDPE